MYSVAGNTIVHISLHQNETETVERSLVKFRNTMATFDQKFLIYCTSGPLQPKPSTRQQNKWYHRIGKITKMLLIPISSNMAHIIKTKPFRQQITPSLQSSHLKDAIDTHII